MPADRAVDPIPVGRVGLRPEPQAVDHHPAGLEALQAVLADAAPRTDAVLSLGDLVGYGADPLACVEIVAERAQRITGGNHDQAVAGLLKYLRELPVDIVKIDKVFVDDLPHDEDGVTLTQAIVGLARSLRLAVVAEGIEAADQCPPLIGGGCALGQGYYFAKPLTTDEVADLLLR